MKNLSPMLKLLLISLLATTQLASAARPKPSAEPDFTKGESLVLGRKNRPTPWALGATGAFANIYYRDPRQIQITTVVDGSPAHGKLKAFDVILGVKSPLVKSKHKTGVAGMFNSEARKALSAAITEAEKKNGKLVLNIWRSKTELVEVPLEKVYPRRRDLAKARKAGKKHFKPVLVKPISGKKLSVTLTLPVKGAFSRTSPWNCKKTGTLIEDAAKYITKRNVGKGSAGIANYIDALGLLATGEKKYIVSVRDFARKKAKECEPLDIMEKGIKSWDGGYLNLFLTEYYLITKDEVVLPGIKALSTMLAYGQSGVGTWSHGMAAVKLNGLYGPSCSYGAMNSCSVVCAMSLVLAQKCGIITKPVNDAVERSRMFYEFYVDKGTIPYGDHKPAHNHDDNGRNSMAAVFFDLLGNKKATTYYTRMTLASHNRREVGHTGHFFGTQWGAIGASRGGPSASNSFIKNTRWFTELERRPEGNSVYQYQLKIDSHKYVRWSTTGQRLLQHCLPRKALYITGKGSSCITPFTDEEVKAVADAATFNPKGLSVKELMTALSSWSLVVRQSAAEELGRRDDNLVEELLIMMDSSSRFERYGACTALRYCGRGSEKVVDKIVSKIESDKDISFQFFAVYALRMLPEKRGEKPEYPHALGSVVNKAAPALLKLAAKKNPQGDPMQKLSGFIADLLLGGRRTDKSGFYPSGRGSEELDGKLLVPAMKAWLANPNGGVRSTASSVYKHASEENLKLLWPDIYYSTIHAAPSGVMFSGGVRADGLNIIAQNRFKEGIDMSLDYLYMDGWGKYKRPPAAFYALSHYGAHIKPYLEEMRTKEYETFIVDRKGKAKKGRAVNKVTRSWKHLFDNIDKEVKLRSIKPFLKGSTVKPPKKEFPQNEK